jgi:hypothetical protein
MRKHSALLAAAVLFVSGGTTFAQSRPPNGPGTAAWGVRSPATGGQGSGSQADSRGPGVTGAPSSTNPQAGGGGGGTKLPARSPRPAGVPRHRARIQTAAKLRSFL